jgi:CheY-like chemotaxis protein
MALRVLLADESSTIKKVFQLALQDYAVEVKSVNLGMDVLAVAQKYKPDVIFADVLLQKQSGYDVCEEIKRDAHLTQTPVVLMWSGFMELDQDKFEASGANGRLEKPFDVKTLRQLVQTLVPKTKSQDMSQYLQFPKLPAMLENSKPQPPPPLRRHCHQKWPVRLPHLLFRHRLPIVVLNRTGQWMILQPYKK